MLERLGRRALAPILLADRLPDAAVVFVGVVYEGPHDQLLHRHRRRVRKEDPLLLQLLVAEPADHGSGLRGALPMERERLLLGATGEILRVLGVPLVEDLPCKVAERLTGRKPRGNVGDPLIRARQVMRGHADGPLLRFGHLLPVPIAQLLEHGGSLLSLGLELLRKRFALRSHDGLLCLVVWVYSQLGRPRRSRECVSSWTGRISITATRAGGNLAATAQASSMSLASTTENPPNSSFVSAKGPGVVETWSARTRMVRAVSARCRAFDAM